MTATYERLTVGAAKATMRRYGVRLRHLTYGFVDKREGCAVYLLLVRSIGDLDRVRAAADRALDTAYDKDDFFEAVSVLAGVPADYTQGLEDGFELFGQRGDSQHYRDGVEDGMALRSMVK
jgi:hypothetical protein